MHRSRVPINLAGDLPDPPRRVNQWVEIARNLPFSRTNRLRASLIAASMLIDLHIVDIR
jgi:hypothetical protein